MVEMLLLITHKSHIRMCRESSSSASSFLSSQHTDRCLKKNSVVPGHPEILKQASKLLIYNLKNGRFIISEHLSTVANLLFFSKIRVLFI